MSGGKPIPVRLSDDIIRRIDAAVKTMGLVQRSSVIKFCLISFLEYFEREGTAGLPLNWKSVLKELDGRTFRYQEKPILKVAEEQAEYGNHKKTRKHKSPT